MISFIILASRLIFILPAAFEHHQQKKAAPQSAPLSTAIRDNT
nr:YfgG family protein [Pantoea piersonii]